MVAGDTILLGEGTGVSRLDGDALAALTTLREQIESLIPAATHPALYRALARVEAAFPPVTPTPKET